MATAQGGAQNGAQADQRPIELNQALRFPCPDKFDGSNDKFEEFAYSLKFYLSAANPAFYDFMVEIENNLNIPFP